MDGSNVLYVMCTFKLTLVIEAYSVLGLHEKESKTSCAITSMTSSVIAQSLSLSISLAYNITLIHSKLYSCKFTYQTTVVLKLFSLIIVKAVLCVYVRVIQCEQFIYSTLIIGTFQHLPMHSMHGLYCISACNSDYNISYGY